MNMSAPCVLAVQQDSLIGRALASVLTSSKSELKLITYQAKDIGGLVAETSELKPDVVILGESTPLAEKESLGQLLVSFPTLRVIVVGEGNNWLHVFSKKDKLVTRQTDLLDVLCLE
jgi:chemotaxis response regulator CheB